MSFTLPQLPPTAPKSSRSRGPPPRTIFSKDFLKHADSVENSPSASVSANTVVYPPFAPQLDVASAPSPAASAPSAEALRNKLFGLERHDGEADFLDRCAKLQQYEAASRGLLISDFGASFDLSIRLPFNKLLAAAASTALLREQVANRGEITALMHEEFVSTFIVRHSRELLEAEERAQRRHVTLLQTRAFRDAVGGGGLGGWSSTMMSFQSGLVVAAAKFVQRVGRRYLEFEVIRRMACKVLARLGPEEREGRKHLEYQWASVMRYLIVAPFQQMEVVKEAEARRSHLLQVEAAQWHRVAEVVAPQQAIIAREKEHRRELFDTYELELLSLCFFEWSLIQRVMVPEQCGWESLHHLQLLLTRRAKDAVALPSGSPPAATRSAVEAAAGHYSLVATYTLQNFARTVIEDRIRGLSKISTARLREDIKELRENKKHAPASVVAAEAKRKLNDAEERESATELSIAERRLKQAEAVELIGRGQIQQQEARGQEKIVAMWLKIQHATGALTDSTIRDYESYFVPIPHTKPTEAAWIIPPSSIAVRQMLERGQKDDTSLETEEEEEEDAYATEGSDDEQPDNEHREVLTRAEEMVMQHPLSPESTITPLFASIVAIPSALAMNRRRSSAIGHSLPFGARRGSTRLLARRASSVTALKLRSENRAEFMNPAPGTWQSELSFMARQPDEVHTAWLQTQQDAQDIVKGWEAAGRQSDTLLSLSTTEDEIQAHNDSDGMLVLSTASTPAYLALLANSGGSDTMPQGALILSGAKVVLAATLARLQKDEEVLRRHICDTLFACHVECTETYMLAMFFDVLRSSVFTAYRSIGFEAIHPAEQLVSEKGVQSLTPVERLSLYLLDATEVEDKTTNSMELSLKRQRDLKEATELQLEHLTAARRSFFIRTTLVVEEERIGRFGIEVDYDVLLERLTSHIRSTAEYQWLKEREELARTEMICGEELKELAEQEEVEWKFYITDVFNMEQELISRAERNIKENMAQQQGQCRFNSASSAASRLQLWWRKALRRRRRASSSMGDRRASMGYRRASMGPLSRVGRRGSSFRKTSKVAVSGEEALFSSIEAAVSRSRRAQDIAHAVHAAVAAGGDPIKKFDALNAHSSKGAGPEHDWLVVRSQVAAGFAGKTAPWPLLLSEIDEEENAARRVVVDNAQLVLEQFVWKPHFFWPILVPLQQQFFNSEFEARKVICEEATAEAIWKDWRTSFQHTHALIALQAEEGRLRNDTIVGEGLLRRKLEELHNDLQHIKKESETFPQAPTKAEKRKRVAERIKLPVLDAMAQLVSREDVQRCQIACAQKREATAIGDAELHGALRIRCAAFCDSEGQQRKCDVVWEEARAFDNVVLTLSVDWPKGQAEEEEGDSDDEAEAKRRSNINQNDPEAWKRRAEFQQLSALAAENSCRTILERSYRSELCEIAFATCRRFGELILWPLFVQERCERSGIEENRNELTEELVCGLVRPTQRLQHLVALEEQFRRELLFEGGALFAVFVGRWLRILANHAEPAARALLCQKQKEEFFSLVFESHQK